MLRVIVKVCGCSARHFEPSEPEYVSDPLAKPNPQSLCAGGEIGPLEIVELSLGRRFAEHRQQPAGK
ncbi:MAG: hypothetical protein U9Q07_05040 [Planctomycetota bacterium]|nr:hypothetical protein [Planctomycetota bacterium]